MISVILKNMRALLLAYYKRTDYYATFASTICQSLGVLTFCGMRPNPWPLPRIANVFETSSVTPPWRARLGLKQLSQSSQDNQCTWHGRYLLII